MDDYGSFASKLTQTGILSDPWIDGRPRFRVEPIVLSAETHRTLSGAAEQICAVYNQVALLCHADPALRERFFTLTPFQALMWDESAPEWHGIARADVFLTTEGPKICELNCDTPSGEAEAVLLGGTAHAMRPWLEDPSALLRERLCTLISEVAQRPTPITVGIIYPTELVEDLSMILLYWRWFEARGFRVVVGSPFNLTRTLGRPGLFGVPCDVFVRHYKTDWWSEREPSRDDEDAFDDVAPLQRELEILLEGVRSGSCAVVNPFGSVLTQNKRAMALMWEAMDRFPVWAADAIRRYIPYTVRLETAAPEVLANRADWVLKSDYGCESAEVLIGAACSEEIWQSAILHAVKGRWIAQRRFIPLCDEEGLTTNFGVYLVGGVTSGYFARVHSGMTDYASTTAAVLIRGEDHE